MKWKMEQWKMKMNDNMNDKMNDVMVEMVDEWKNDGWYERKNGGWKTEMVDDIWCGEIEATNPASCLSNYYYVCMYICMYVYIYICMYVCMIEIDFDIYIHI